MITRSRRSNRNEELLILSNAELARVERANRQRRPNPADMGDNGNPEHGCSVAAASAADRADAEGSTRSRTATSSAIGDKDNPHTFYQNRSAIVPPNVQRQDFEIKPGMIALVKDHIFHGLPAEIPADHIQNFEEICSTTGSNGVPADFLKCKLFPAAFLDHFYTKSKNAALRTKIASFQQYDGEAFCEAWERYKECRRECPHHGYSDEQILSIFYDGVNWDYRML
ncbi:unnamed protein product [Microthlaspi erraticum]|uniref:Retrotransposon gag domain-containing protein n=1 Tax=Microthlaspi erraticum TaxID=1685480 RepID=A0A6D2IK57_9BRAS|nr:unnamed protein product [Microthlaspi erraticum]